MPASKYYRESLAYMRRDQPKMLRYFRGAMGDLTDEQIDIQIKESRSRIKKKRNQPLVKDGPWHIHNVALQMTLKEKAKRNKKPKMPRSRHFRR